MRAPRLLVPATGFEPVISTLKGSRLATRLSGLFEGSKK